MIIRLAPIFLQRPFRLATGHRGGEGSGHSWTARSRFINGNVPLVWHAMPANAFTLWAAGSAAPGAHESSGGTTSWVPLTWREGSFVVDFPGETHEVLHAADAVAYGAGSSWFSTTNWTYSTQPRRSRSRPEVRVQSCGHGSDPGLLAGHLHQRVQRQGRVQETLRLTGGDEIPAACAWPRCFAEDM